MIAEDVKIVKSEDVIIPSVKEVDKLILPADVSSIQFTPLSLEVSNNFDSNLIGFVDHIGFKTKFAEETKRIANIDKLLVKGNGFVHMLYTFRSVSRAMPMTVSFDFNYFSLYNLFFVGSQILSLDHNPPMSKMLIKTIKRMSSTVSLLKYFDLRLQSSSI